MSGSRLESFGKAEGLLGEGFELVLARGCRVRLGPHFDAEGLASAAECSGEPAVLMLPPSVRIFVASQPVDLRQSFDRLAACAAGAVGRQSVFRPSVRVPQSPRRPGEDPVLGPVGILSLVQAAGAGGLPFAEARRRAGWSWSGRSWLCFLRALIWRALSVVRVGFVVPPERDLMYGSDVVESVYRCYPLSRICRPTLQSLVLELFGTLQEKDRRIDQLSSQLEALKRHLFGRRSEKLDPDQLGLDLGELSVAEVEEVEASSAEEPAREGVRRGHGRRRLPSDLPRDGSSTTSRVAAYLCGVPAAFGAHRRRGVGAIRVCAGVVFCA